MKQEDFPILGFHSDLSGRVRSRQNTKAVKRVARPQASIEKLSNLDESEPVLGMGDLQKVQERSRQMTVIHPNMEILTKYPKYPRTIQKTELVGVML